MIIDAQRFLDTGQMIFGIFVIGVIGLVSDFLFKQLNQRLFSVGGVVSSLTIEGVGRVFPPAHRGGAATVALQPTDLAVAHNDFITILGPSGCGKSTLLRIVAGLDTPTSGRVLMDGQPVGGPGPDRGMVFQSYSLFPWMTVRENICFGLARRGCRRRSRRRSPAISWRRSGCGSSPTIIPKTLSGGMKQRTALARALANDPKVLLLDEPFGALDNQTRALMQELLLGIWEADRKTVLFVTHDIDEAIFLANRVVVMTARPGRIKCDVAVDLPHPRTYTVKTTPEFAEYKARLTEEIRVETIKALRTEGLGGFSTGGPSFETPVSRAPQEEGIFDLRPHPEERRAAPSSEGWASGTTLSRVADIVRARRSGRSARGSV